MPDHSKGEKPERRKMVLISASDLMRDSLLADFGEAVDADIACFRSVEDWMRQDDFATCSLIVFDAHGDHGGDKIARLGDLRESLGGRPHFVVLADSEQPADIIRSIECGARGYIPTSFSPDLMIEVISFVLRGGVYCPPCDRQG
jgi:DNA-binding NarL/FixJ family response regulator